MPCPFTCRRMFCAGTSFLCQTKNLFTNCASHKHFVPDKKDDLHSVKLVFVRASKFLGWHKKFGTAQNILGPVKGQGI